MARVRRAFDRLKEAIELIRLLWETERVTYDGAYYKTVKATVYDHPGPLPIYVGAGGPRMARYAGQSADGFICTSGKGMDLYERTLLPAVAAGLGDSGREPASIDRMIEIKLSFDLDREHALAGTRFWAALALTGEQKAGLDNPIDMERAGDELPLDRIASRWIVVSDPEEAVRRIRPYVDAGFTHLIFHAPAADQSRFLTSFADHVAPALRDLTGGSRTAAGTWLRQEPADSDDRSHL